MIVPHPPFESRPFPIAVNPFLTQSLQAELPHPPVLLCSLVGYGGINCTNKHNFILWFYSMISYQILCTKITFAGLLQYKVLLGTAGL